MKPSCLVLVVRSSNRWDFARETDLVVAALVFLAFFCPYEESQNIGGGCWRMGMSDEEPACTVLLDMVRANPESSEKSRQIS